MQYIIFSRCVNPSGHWSPLYIFEHTDVLICLIILVMRGVHSSLFLFFLLLPLAAHSTVDRHLSAFRNWPLASTTSHCTNENFWHGRNRQSKKIFLFIFSSFLPSPVHTTSPPPALATDHFAASSFTEWTAASGRRIALFIATTDNGVSQHW